jgi:hypothetical protein
MSAVLLLASAHINHFLPRDSLEYRPVLHHYGNALSGLRTALAEELTAESFDSIMGASMLLIQYSWTHTDFGPSNQLDISYIFQETVSLFHGLKDCVVASQDIFYDTKWAKVLKYSPRASLEQFVLDHGDRSDFQRMFDHCLFCGLGTKCRGGTSADNMNAASRLLLPLHAIKLSLPHTRGSAVSFDISRFLFTWPTLCTKGFVQQIKENHPTSLTLLLYYYAGVVSILSDDVWFMRDRAVYMYNLLKSKLEGYCDRCTGPAIALCDPNSWPVSWDQQEGPDFFVSCSSFGRPNISSSQETEGYTAKSSTAKVDEKVGD